MTSLYWAAQARYRPAHNVADWQIVLQKSKVAVPRIFRENKKRETISDSCTLNRITEVTGKFSVRGSVLDAYTDEGRLEKQK